MLDVTAERPSPGIVRDVVTEAMSLLQVVLSGVHRSTLSAAHLIQMALRQPVQFVHLLLAVVSFLLQPQADLQQMTLQLGALQPASSRDGFDRSPTAPATPARHDT